MTYPVCPEGCDLTGAPIPQEYRDAGYYGDDSPTHYSRVIGYDGGRDGIYDGVIFWLCPECGSRWHRWDAVTGTTLRRKVEALWARLDAAQ